MQKKQLVDSNPYHTFEDHFSYGSDALDTENSLKQIFEYHNQTGGSRIRAKLAIECSINAGLSPMAAVRLASACECLHQASLLHDDIIDADAQRRGAEAVWSKFGSYSAICLGDELIGQAFAELAHLEQPYNSQIPNLIQYASQAISRSAAGQVLDCSLNNQNQTDLEPYEKASGNKSGPLLALPFGLTMIVVGEDDVCFDCLKEITSAFGTAYQLIDDFEDRNDDDEEQLNGYWVMYDITSNHSVAKQLLVQRYHWYRRVILKGRECLPHYCQGALDSLYGLLANKAKSAGLFDE